MKTFLLAVIALSAAIARADVVVIHEMDMLGTKTKVVTSVKGAFCRVDYGDKMSMITNTATGDIISLNHAAKRATIAAGADVKAAAAKMPKDDKPSNPPLVASGQKEKVGGYDCEIYVMEGEKPAYRVWVAKDFPGFEEVMASKNALRKLAVAEHEPDVPGLTLRSELKEADGTLHKMELIKPCKIIGTQFRQLHTLSMVS